MRINWIVLSFILLFNFSISNDLENFYKILKNSPVVKLKINFTQNQFDRNFNSSGDFYILGHQKYFYESPDIIIYVDSSYAMTKNLLSRQIIYNSLDEMQFSLFDILSGNRKHIEFGDINIELNRFAYSIPSVGFKGYFLFESKSSLLKLIFMKIGINQHITISVDEFKILENYLPKIGTQGYEVIDLRG